MPLPKSICLLLIGALILTNIESPLGAQGSAVDQMAFSTLKEQAASLASSGQLKEAVPLLKELVKRIQSTGETEMQLDYPYFLIGTGYIQYYVDTGQPSHLSSTLEWYDRLEKEYPNSKNLKPALLKRVDVLRALQRTDDAVALMQALVGGQKKVTLSIPQEINLLKDLCQIYYGRGQLKDGIPYFRRLANEGRTIEEKALGTAATFEGLVEDKQLDEAIQLLPVLAKESDVRYMPRLNVALLKASDTMVENERFTDAALLLNLIKTTDQMIRYNEDKLKQKQNVLKRLQIGNGSNDRIDQLEQEIKNTEKSLKSLRDLPSLRNDLLVRRARNFTKTNRPFESFWMFHDLFRENPEDPRAEFYHYATFSGARKIEKHDVVLELGKTYRAQYPEGDYYSDVTAGMIDTLEDTEDFSEMLAVLKDFLDQRPMDAFSAQFLATWAARLFEEERLPEVIEQCAAWQEMHKNPVFEDGLYYWPGMARMLLSEYREAIGQFEGLIRDFPASAYTPDGTLRKGICHYYEQEITPAREALTTYIERYPLGELVDQAYYFLGEVESLAGYLELAIDYFKKADELTESQEMHDGVAFRIGELLESLGRYEEMLDHFIAYTERFDNRGQLSEALFQIGRAYELLNRPTEMLALYRKSIIQFAEDPENHGVDTLIEAYSEKYETNLSQLRRTVEFLDKMRDDLDFRKQMVTDRGALFEEFYNNPDIIQDLYNDLRTNPGFTIDLMEDLSPIEPAGVAYRRELNNYPKDTPEVFFRNQLTAYRNDGKPIAETRMLMGLYRSGTVLEPATPFESSLLDTLSPRLILYVADYFREKEIDRSVEAWQKLLERFPADDATIVAYLRLADFEENKGNTEEALNYLISAAEAFPASPQLPLMILRQGELLTRLNRTGEAREKYQYILRVPDWRGVLHARALYQTGQAFMAEGEFPAAHGFFERTFLGYSHFAEWSARAYLADADALLGMDDPASAAATLEEALTELKEAAPADLYKAIQEKSASLQTQ